MEPIRPDSDEVAARKNEGRRGDRGTVDRNAPSSRAAPGAAQGAGAKKRSSVVPVLLATLVVLGLGWLMVQQYQTVQQLQSNLGEAEDWINRTKLSMARFEGRLSEADRELLESGSEITEKLAFLDSEMRKLWGVANDRNRKAIAANREATEFLEKKTDYLDKQRAEQGQLLAVQAEELQATQETVQSLQETVQAIQETTQSLDQQVAGLDDRQQTFEEALEEAIIASTEAIETVRTAQDELQSRVNTLTQRQTLSLDELRARLDAVENQVAAAGDQSAVNSLQEQLADLETIVDSIDASRSQITSRLIQLEQRLEGGSGD